VVDAGGKSLEETDPMAGLNQASYDPSSAAAAQHSPAYSSSSHYAPFAQTDPHGSFGQQAAHPPPPFLQTSTPPLHAPHQSAVLDWTSPPPPPGPGTTPQLPSSSSFPHMHGSGGTPPTAIKQEETDFQTGFMPDPHYVAGRPGNPSSLGYSADARTPSLYAADAHTANRQQRATAELNGLLHGDSGISANSQILLDVDLRPRNGTPTSRRDDPLRAPSASAHAEMHAPMTEGLKKRRGATARKPSAAAGQSPMSHDTKKKKKGGRAALTSVKSPVAEPRGKKRKGEQWEENLEDAAAVMAGLDDVLFDLGDDVMDIDGSLADLTAADLLAAAAVDVPAAAAAGDAPQLHGSFSAAPQPDSAAQLMQPAAGPTPAFTAHPRGSRSPAVQRDLQAAAVAGGVRQQKSQRQRTAAVAGGVRQQKIQRQSTAAVDGGVLQQQIQRQGTAARAAGGMLQQQIQRQGTAARAAVGGSCSAKQPAMPPISSVMPSASMGGPSADQSGASASPSAAAASHIGQGSAAAAQTGPPGTLPGRRQAMTRIARRVKGSCAKETWGYEEGEVVWAQSRGHPWWPAMVSHQFTYFCCL